MKPRELLRKAADEIARTGHWKEKYSQPGTPEQVAPVCAYGALTRAATGGKTTVYGRDEHLETWHLIDLAADLLAETIEGGTRGEESPSFGIITHFNDDPSTTGEDVILMMKKAAER